MNPKQTDQKITKMWLNKDIMNKQACLQTTLYSVLVFTSVSVFSEQSDQLSARIVGGSEASTTEYPWVASLKYNSGLHFCGGSLIDQQWILTAAHCVIDATASQFTATIGEYDLASDPVTSSSEIQEIIIHPDYNSSTFNNDIALVKLSNASTENVINRLSSINTESLLTDNNSITTAIGWGSTIAYSASEVNPSADTPNILQAVSLPLLSAASCKQAMPMTNDNMICAGNVDDGGVDSCQGDSGGPLLTSNNEQIGIVSFGSGCAQAGNPGVYTKVANYNEWIDSQINGFVATNKSDYFVTQPSQTKTYQIDFENRSDREVFPTFNFSNTQQFTIQSNTCTAVAAAASCSITLNFISSDFGSHINTITIDTNDNAVSSNSVEVKVTVMENVDASELTFVENNQVQWLQSANTPWIVSDQNYVYSPGISNNQSSQISALITGSGILKFNWAVSSETNADFLNFYIDGQLQDNISGNKQFQEQRFEISGTETIVTWQFMKDSSDASGLDAAYLHHARLIQSVDEPNEDIISPPILDFSGNAVTVFKSTGGGGSVNLWGLFALMLCAFYKQGLSIVRDKGEHK